MLLQIGSCAGHDIKCTYWENQLINGAVQGGKIDLDRKPGCIMKLSLLLPVCRFPRSGMTASHAIVRTGPE